MRRRLALFFGVSAVAVALLGVGLLPRTIADYESVDAPAMTFDEWAAAKVAESEAKGAWPTATEKLVRHGERTELVFVYLHGFGASRGEGEWLVDQLAERYQANTWYVRLPGHGTDMDDHAAQTHADYLRAAEEALWMSQQLGEQVVLVGCSTGALLATWLAAEHPDQVDALVLGSPYYALRDPLGFMVDSDLGLRIAATLFGEPRDASYTGERRQVGYEGVWLEKQHWAALRGLSDLRRYIMDSDPAPRVQAPVLMLSYPDDTVVDPEVMREQYDRMRPHPASAFTEIADADHVMWSSYVRTDKEAVKAAIDGFADRLGWAPPPPPAPPEPTPTPADTPTD